MSRRSTAEGMQVRAFAKHLGCSVQWARKLKREGSAEWKAFTAAQVSASPAPAAAPPPPPMPEDDLARALRAKESAWQLLCRATEAAQAGSTVLTEQVALNRAMKDAQDAYERARKNAAAVQIEAQKWVAIEKVAAIRGAIQQHLADVVQNWETTLAGALPDELRPLFYKAFQEAKPAWNAGVLKVDAYIQTLLPVPC